MGIWVARESCGCIVAASIDEQSQEDLAKDIGEWVLRGNIVTHLDVESLQMIKCPAHIKPNSPR